jgi:hypothetical protein
MWGSFCDLAMAGGPPHKGKLLEPASPELVLAEPERYAQVCNEIVRGIELAARLRAEPSSSPGWLRVRCANQTMAGWLLRAVTMENVSVRMEDGALLLPAGTDFRIEKEIKNVITVTTKTAHYWRDHLHRLQKIGVANVFADLDSNAPLLQPSWGYETEDADARRRIERALETATGLQATEHGYTNWIGLAAESVSSAIITMRRLVASNILSRREQNAIFVPFNPRDDPRGIRLAGSVAELLARGA